MSEVYFIRESAGAVASVIDILTTLKKPADWVLCVAGGAITITDGGGTDVPLIRGAGDVIPGPIRRIVSSAGKVGYGTGDLPVSGTTAAAGSSASAAATSETNAAASASAAATSATAAATSATTASTQATNAATSATAAASSATSAAAKALAVSVQKDFAADSLAADTLAETRIGAFFGPCNVDPAISPFGALTADDTNYATFTFKLYHGGSVTQTWTMSTKITAGTGNWTAGTLIPKGSPQAAAAGDWLTVTVTKPGTGVQLPAHACGVKVS